MAVWYLAHDNELLIDLDDASRPAKSGGTWLEIFFRRRLRNAIEDGKLPVSEVWLCPSTSERHYHAFVRLATAMTQLERLVWQLHLGSDLYRGRADLMRAARGFPAPSLLIRPEPIKDFYREPDRCCPCTTKHVTAEAPACEVWRELRGLSPWELFGKSDPGLVERAVRLNKGRVLMSRLLAREGVHDGGSEKTQAAGDPVEVSRRAAAGAAV